MAEAAVNWKTEEQLRRELDVARAELARVRRAAALDLQNAHNDLVAKNRVIGRLEAELAKVRDDDDGTAESRDVKELLVLWRRWVRGDNKRVNINHPSRKKAMLGILKLYGRKRTENAIRGMPYDDWAMGRTPRSTKPFNDVKYLASDAERFESFERLWEINNPENRHGQLQLRDTAKDVEHAGFLVEGGGRPGPIARWVIDGYEGRWPPIQTVLYALRERGQTVTAHESRPDSWSCQCPAHADRSPSLSVHRAANGNVMLHCFSGCPTENVLAAMGLRFRDLFVNAERDRGRVDALYEPTAAERRPSAHIRKVTRELFDVLATWGQDEAGGEGASQ